MTMETFMENRMVDCDYQPENIPQEGFESITDQPAYPGFGNDGHLHGYRQNVP
jgi:hypothetical protein